MTNNIAFSAKDATKLVEDYNNLLEGESRKEYIKIISIIAESAKQGKTLSEFNGLFSTPITNKLKENGFAVKKISNQYEDSYTTVSW